MSDNGFADTFGSICKGFTAKLKGMVVIDGVGANSVSH
jgi:hypothetical protein